MNGLNAFFVSALVNKMDAVMLGVLMSSLANLILQLRQSRCSHIELCDGCLRIEREVPADVQTEVRS